MMFDVEIMAVAMQDMAMLDRMGPLAASDAGPTLDAALGHVPVQESGRGIPTAAELFDRPARLAIDIQDLSVDKWAVARGVLAARLIDPETETAELPSTGGKAGSLSFIAFGDEEDEEIIVKGDRPPNLDDGDDGGAGGGYGDGSYGDGEGNGGIGDGGAGGGTLDDPEDANDCRDRKALDAQADIRSEPDRHTKEHGVIVYRDAAGMVRNSPVIEGGEHNILRESILAIMAANGITFTQVIGFVHNHPAYAYGNAPELNRYPSGGALAGGDWDAADWFVSNGAGGPGGEGFALYILDTSLVMREFEYKDREIYKNLNSFQRENGVNLPEAVENDGSSCE